MRKRCDYCGAAFTIEKNGNFYLCARCDRARRDYVHRTEEIDAIDRIASFRHVGPPERCPCERNATLTMRLDRRKPRYVRDGEEAHPWQEIAIRVLEDDE